MAASVGKFIGIMLLLGAFVNSCEWLWYGSGDEEIRQAKTQLRKAIARRKKLEKEIARLEKEGLL